MNEDSEEDAFEIPASIRSSFAEHAKSSSLEDFPLGSPADPPKEIALGVVLIPGAWNVTLISQDDGIVILEAPISSGYSVRVIEEAGRRFRGKKIKAVITTSDSWPHLAGIREYVARGIPIYALDSNRAVLERTVSAPHTAHPDTLQLRPREPQWHLIDQATMLGGGKNRLEIIPMRGETTERQQMVYFPEHHLLYGSDPFQRQQQGSGFFYPQTVSELRDAVTRNHLTVDKFFMMHVDVSSWSEIDSSLQRAISTDSLNGTMTF